MNYRKCPACHEQTDGDTAICTRCNKAVLVFDFSGEKTAGISFGDMRPVYGQVCGWVDAPAGSKPPREWRCWIREPEVFTLE